MPPPHENPYAGGLDGRLRTVENALGRHDERLKVLEKAGEVGTAGRRFNVTLAVSFLTLAALIVFQVINLAAGG